MGIVTPTNKEVLDFEGLHLYHAGISNCAMRARIALEEKGLAWTSHHLDILQKEHLTPEYFGINPKGLVPTLVDDGVVIVESDDIIDHIDKKFPSPPLRPTSEEGQEQMYEWMKLAVNNHITAVKPYIYYHKVQKFMRKTEEEQSEYEKLQSDQDLKKFHTKNSSGGGFTLEEVAQAEKILTDCFVKAERALKDQDWLVEDQFSLADIAWVPLHFTLIRAEFSFDEYPEINAWAERITKRESFKKAVLDWWPGFGG
ncbi:MAG TPA: glutathione S-transferase family protein [Gammaproteobacteria bacterium]|nr:glutathione S-transferase family protein [Gammaproteobacteria bacterium]